MVNEDVVQLAEKFKALQLHAARGGREVSRVLHYIIAHSQAADSVELLHEVRENVAYLLRHLPPYAPPLNSINTIMISLEEAARMNTDISTAKRIFEADKNQTNNPLQTAKAIAEFLLDILPDSARIYTHTLSETVLNTMLELDRRGRIAQVFVTESRPNNDGWDTAIRLCKSGLDVSITIDAAMTMVIEKSDCMLCGVEAIRGDGSIIGKVGALPAAILCKISAKPVYAIADTGKICPFDQLGGFRTSFGQEDLGIKPDIEHLKVIGDYFDLIPARYIESIVTEKGLIPPKDIHPMVQTERTSVWLDEQLKAVPA